ncbi:hypothetical protein, partial [Klebsiella pneumoniae]|uniref:hypothetical protein n=1 Tax=Klebsiella pneumoniae TaxID=573 RepID=UPI001C8F5572
KQLCNEMNYICTLCGEEYNDEWLFIAHKELYHDTNITLEPARPSVIQYAPPRHDPLKTELLAEAFPKSVVRHFRIKNTNSNNYFEFLNNVKTNITACLKSEL